MLFTFEPWCPISVLLSSPQKKLRSHKSFDGTVACKADDHNPIKLSLCSEAHLLVTRSSFSFAPPSPSWRDGGFFAEVYVAGTSFFPQSECFLFFFLSSISWGFVIPICMHKSIMCSEGQESFVEHSGCSPLLQHSLVLHTVSSTSPWACPFHPVSSCSIMQPQGAWIILKYHSPHPYHYLFVFPCLSPPWNSPIYHLLSLPLIPILFSAEIRVCPMPHTLSVPGAEAPRRSGWALSVHSVELEDRTDPAGSSPKIWARISEQ